MPRPGLTPASRPAPNRGHRGWGAEVDRKQLKPITTQDPYSTEPCLTERESVCGQQARAHQRQGLEELRRNSSVSPDMPPEAASD